MKIELSQKAFLIIESELETTNEEISWELEHLPSYHKGEETDMYRYWKKRQDKLAQALSELRKMT
jgi:hypothetical protein